MSTKKVPLSNPYQKKTAPTMVPPPPSAISPAAGFLPKKPPPHQPPACSPALLSPAILVHHTAPSPAPIPPSLNLHAASLPAAASHGHEYSPSATGVNASIQSLTTNDKLVLDNNPSISEKVKMDRNSKRTMAALKSAICIFDHFQLERGEATMAKLSCP